MAVASLAADMLNSCWVIFVNYFPRLNPMFLGKDRGKLIEQIFLILQWKQMNFLYKKLKLKSYYDYSIALRLVREI